MEARFSFPGHQPQRESAPHADRHRAKAIPAAEMAMNSIIGSHYAEVYNAADESEVRFAIGPDDYYSDK